MAEAKIENYLNWIKDNGGSFKKIELRQDSQGVGCVYTTDTVHENESFATVPFKICITEHVARKALPQLAAFSGRVVQALYLLLQKHMGEKSFYWPYINILPETIKTPLFFDDNDMLFIKNTNLESALRERKTALFLDYEKLLEHLPQEVEKNDITWEDFLWSYSVFSSRAFPYKLIGPSSDESEVLFPLVDALNHKPNTKITWSANGDAETGSLSFVAGEQYNAGDEIFNNYGPKSNEELLLGYGFCFEFNEYDHIALKPNFTQDPNHDMKLNIMKQCNVSSGNADPLTFYIHRNNIPHAFFKLMRVLVMNPLETQYYANCSNSELLDFVGYRNELSMISMTTAMLKSKLQALKSVQLPTENLSYWQKFSLMYRSGQEDVYTNAVNKMEEMKYNIIHRMHQDSKENRLAPNAPFLSINNPSHQPASIDMTVDSNEFLTLDSVAITVKRLLNKDAAFSAIVSDNFEVEEEADIVMMLCLIKERSKDDSEWRQFFEKVSQSVIAEEDTSELKEMYDSLIPAFNEAYPDIFDLNVFSFQAFVWADTVINGYSIESPFFAIVPL